MRPAIGRDMRETNEDDAVAVFAVFAAGPLGAKP